MVKRLSLSKSMCQVTWPQPIERLRNIIKSVRPINKSMKQNYGLNPYIDDGSENRNNPAHM